MKEQEHIRRNPISRILAASVTIVICALPGNAAQKPEDGTKKLTLHCAGPVVRAAELQLLPKVEELVDADAFPLYQKAVQSLPKELDWGRIRAWRQVTVSQLSQEEVGAVLRSFEASVPLLEQAGRCKRCNWVMSAEGDAPIDLNGCRNMVFLLALKARSELARGDCTSCVRTLGTGLAMARHLNTGPTAIHLLVGVATGAVVFTEVEQYVQQPGSPSLGAAIRAIPAAFFDKEHSEIYGMDEEGRNRVQLLVTRANRQLAALQYVETLRQYATKAGHWPQGLAELKADLPDDPVSDKPFSYKRLSETQAILEGPLPTGGDAVKDALRYELAMVQ